MTVYTGVNGGIPRGDGGRRRLYIGRMRVYSGREKGIPRGE